MYVLFLYALDLIYFKISILCGIALDILSLI